MECGCKALYTCDLRRYAVEYGVDVGGAGGPCPASQGGRQPSADRLRRQQVHPVRPVHPRLRGCPRPAGARLRGKGFRHDGQARHGTDARRERLQRLRRLRRVLPHRSPHGQASLRAAGAVAGDPGPLGVRLLLPGVSAGSARGDGRHPVGGIPRGCPRQEGGPVRQGQVRNRPAPVRGPDPHSPGPEKRRTGAGFLGGGLAGGGPPPYGVPPPVWRRVDRRPCRRHDDTGGEPPRRAVRPRGPGHRSRRKLRRDASRRSPARPGRFSRPDRFHLPPRRPGRCGRDRRGRGRSRDDPSGARHEDSASGPEGRRRRGGAFERDRPGPPVDPLAESPQGSVGDPARGRPATDPRCRSGRQAVDGDRRWRTGGAPGSAGRRSEERSGEGVRRRFREGGGAGASRGQREKGGRRVRPGGNGRTLVGRSMPPGPHPGGDRAPGSARGRSPSARKRRQRGSDRAGGRGETDLPDALSAGRIRGAVVLLEDPLSDPEGGTCWADWRRSSSRTIAGRARRRQRRSCSRHRPSPKRMGPWRASTERFVRWRRRAARPAAARRPR